VTPRPYRMGRRQAAVDKTRARIVAAARRLLLARRPTEFSLEGVARRARVTRMTVYHRFGSRRELLEALFDELAAEGGMSHLRNAFQQPDAEQALADHVATFVRFWSSGRLIHRRLRAQGVLDPELERALAARQEWRRQGLRVVAGRLVQRPADDLIDVLFTLTSFETFDTLAGGTRTPAQVTSLVLGLVRGALGLALPSPTLPKSSRNRSAG